MTIRKGDLVTPVTKAGVQITDTPCNGEYHQKRNVRCVFIGNGTVVKVSDTVIDYDEWDRIEGAECQNLGKVKYRSLLVQCQAGIGWVGEGAVKKVVGRK